MGGRKMVVPWFVVVVLVISSSWCSADEPKSKTECVQACITDCAKKGGSMCLFNCCVDCKWPLAEQDKFKDFEEEALKQSYNIH